MNNTGTALTASDTQAQKTKNKTVYRRLRGGALLGGLLLLACLLLWAFLAQRPAHLLDRATRIVSVGNNSRAIASFWTSDRQVLLIRPKAAQNGFEAVLTEVGKTPVVLQPFTRRYRDSLANTFTAISPDRQRLVLSDHASGFIAVALDGSGEVLRDRKTGMSIGNIFWLPDGKHWVEVGAKDNPNAFPYTGYQIHEVRIYDAHSPNVRVVRIPGNITDYCPLGVTSAGRLLLYETNYGQLLTNLSLLECSLDTPVSVVRPFAIPMSDIISLYDMAFTSEGDRLALAMTRYYPPSGSLFLRGFFERIGVPGHFEQGIWVTSLQGEGLRLVGVADIAKHAFTYFTDKDLRQQPYGLAWLPGGKRLSFFLEETLWTVPAD